MQENGAEHKPIYVCGQLKSKFGYPIVEIQDVRNLDDRLKEIEEGSKKFQIRISLDDEQERRLKELENSVITLYVCITGVSVGAILLFLAR